jgi:hypothetical protein
MEHIAKLKQVLTTPQTLLLAFGLVIGSTAAAQQQSVTYRLNFIHPTAGTSEARIAADAVEAIIGERGRPQKQIGMYPDSPPVSPGAPAFRTINFGPVSQQVLQCSGAYAQFVWIKDSGANPIGGSGERYTGCVFVSKLGIRSSIVIERYTRSSGSLLGGIVGGIRNAIEGDDAQWGHKTVSRFTEIYKQRVPTVLVELIETPEGVQTPDGAKVADILNRATSGSQESSSVSTVTTSAAAVASNTMAEVIDARKNITAMGMVYHSVDHLQEALARKDQLAVELFIKAGGVRADARGKSGQTSIEYAESVGDPVLLDLIKKLK